MISIATAILIFLLGQFLLRLIIEPLMDQRKRAYRALHVTRMWSHIFANPRMTTEVKEAMIRDRLIEPDDDTPTRPAAAYDTIRSETREAAADLVVGTSQLFFYRFWALLGIVPSLDSVRQVHRSLIGLSNSLTQEDQAIPNAESMDLVERLLRVPKELLSIKQ